MTALDVKGTSMRFCCWHKCATVVLASRASARFIRTTGTNGIDELLGRSAQLAPRAVCKSYEVLPTKNLFRLKFEELWFEE